MFWFGESKHISWGNDLSVVYSLAATNVHHGSCRDLEPGQGNQPRPKGTIAETNSGYWGVLGAIRPCYGAQAPLGRLLTFYELSGLVSLLEVSPKLAIP